MSSRSSQLTQDRKNRICAEFMRVQENEGREMTVEDIKQYAVNVMGISIPFSENALQRYINAMRKGKVVVEDTPGATPNPPKPTEKPSGHLPDIDIHDPSSFFLTDEELAERLGAADVEPPGLKIEHHLRQTLKLYSDEEAANILEAKKKKDIGLYRRGVEASEKEWRRTQMPRLDENDPSIEQTISNFNKLKARTDEDIRRAHEEQYLQFKARLETTAKSEKEDKSAKGESRATEDEDTIMEDVEEQETGDERLNLNRKVDPERMTEMNEDENL